MSLTDALGHSAADKRIDILRGIARSGSISQAARDAGVSYKAAWQALDTLSNLAGVALVHKAVGGAGGGGAVLTAAGQQLLQAAEALAQARDEVLARWSATGTLGGAVGLGLRTSMRNQLRAQVTAVQRHGALVQVALVLAGGAPWAARLTRESAELLDLHPGLPVLALCKATAARVQPHAPLQGDAGRAQPLWGRVQRTAAAGEAQEVVLALAGGQQIVGFTAAGVKLRKGVQAQVEVDPAAVVLAAV